MQDFRALKIQYMSNSNQVRGRGVEKRPVNGQRLGVDEPGCVSDQ